MCPQAQRWWEPTGSCDHKGRADPARSAHYTFFRRRLFFLFPATARANRHAADKWARRGRPRPNYLSVTDSHAKSAAFARGFFTFLESRQVRSAILHGGADGFKRELSDVDFVVDHPTFSELPALIGKYCALAGWQLCQVLRHETTAAYFVCSAIDDPSCAVALDACSDYQRNGTVFLHSDNLLENRRPLPWGGHGLSPVTELRYRFAKAAAKNKDVEASAAEFATYPEQVRNECTTWLEEQWGIHPDSWDGDGLTAAFTHLRSRSNSRPPLIQKGALGRILRRLHHPTGLIVIAGRDDFDLAAARLESIFGHLYFRRFKKSNSARASMLKDLVSSCLIIVPELGTLWRKTLPPNCIHRLNPAHDPCTQSRELAKHLHERCVKREGV